MKGPNKNNLAVNLLSHLCNNFINGAKNQHKSTMKRPCNLYLNTCIKKETHVSYYKSEIGLQKKNYSLYRKFLFTLHRGLA